MKKGTKRHSLTANEISKITGMHISSVNGFIKKKEIKPLNIKIIKNNKFQKVYYLKRIALTFRIGVFIPIVKKRRKPYFEFSSLILESKINQNGID